MEGTLTSCEENCLVAPVFSKTLARNQLQQSWSGMGS